MKTSGYLLLAMLMVQAVFAPACGKNRIDIPTAPVNGMVTFEGKPLSAGRVVFLHSKSGHAAAASLNADGSFTLNAYQGENQVAIDSMIDKPEDSKEGGGLHTLKGPGMRTLHSRIPIRYGEFSSSGFTFNVEARENKANFILVEKP